MLIEVKKIEYPDNANNEVKWFVLINSQTVAAFSLEESANKFINSKLCSDLIEHERKKNNGDYKIGIYESPFDKEVGWGYKTN